MVAASINLSGFGRVVYRRVHLRSDSEAEPAVDRLAWHLV